MSQILLIDFHEKEIEKLKSEGHDVELNKTNWISGGTNPLIPSNDCKIIFYNANNPGLSSSDHIDDTKHFEALVSAGSVMVCFLGNTRGPHITNLTGISLPSESIHYNDQPSRIEPVQDSVFTPIFSRFGNHINTCASLGHGQINLPIKIDLKEDKQVIAIHKVSEYPVAIYFRCEEGFFLLLPYFGDKNVEVIKLLLNKIIPDVRPDLFEDKENKWLHDSQYYVPSLLDLQSKRKSIEEEYALKIKEIGKKIKELQEKEQDILNKLLTSKEEELKETVIHWLKYIGFTVIDVDKYYQEEDSSRQKEEDLWLFQKKEPDVSKDELILVEVKSSKGSASDDDVGVIQKYKGRRMQEFGHTNIKGFLIGNYFCNTPAYIRKLPFSNNQLKDAKRDNNALLTTYELFEAIRMEKGKKLTKKDIQAKIRDSDGVINWNKHENQS